MSENLPKEKEGLSNVYTTSLLSERGKSYLEGKIEADAYFAQAVREAEQTARRKIDEHVARPLSRPVLLLGLALVSVLVAGTVVTVASGSEVGSSIVAFLSLMPLIYFAIIGLRNR